MLSSERLLAQEPSPEDSKSLTLDGINTPVGNWRETELEQWINLVVDEKITVEQTARTYTELTEEQIKKAAEYLAIKSGVPVDEVQIDLAERDQTRDTESYSTPMYPGPIYTWGCYPCEYAGDALMNPVLSHYTTDSTECGSADSDRYTPFGLAASKGIP